jgi:hypothetical protein
VNKLARAQHKHKVDDSSEETAELLIGHREEGRKPIIN